MFCSEAENASPKRSERNRILQNDTYYGTSVISNIALCWRYCSDLCYGKEEKASVRITVENIKRGYKEQDFIEFMMMITNDGMPVYLLQEDGFTAQATLYYDEELRARTRDGLRSIGVHSLYRFVFRNRELGEIKVNLGSIVKLTTACITCYLYCRMN